MKLEIPSHLVIDLGYSLADQLMAQTDHTSRVQQAKSCRYLVRGVEPEYRKWAVDCLKSGVRLFRKHGRVM